jgi:hypothetical protein
MNSSDSLKGLLPLSILQIGCGSFGMHLKKHLESRVESLIVISGKDASLPDPSQFDLIFLAANDSSLKSLISEIRKTAPQVDMVHFSGFHYFKETLGLHPVASFNKKSKYNLDEITFVADGIVDENLKIIFPRSRQIHPQKKQIYHTYLSVSANALQLLMNKIGQDFENELDMKPDLLKKIVIQSLQEEVEKGSTSFSGPWIRGEKKLQDETVDTIKSETLKNLNQLFLKEIKTFERHKENHNKEGSHEHS